MKAAKGLSGLVFGLGCATVFVGLLALILPAVQNEQLALVLASFETPSDNVLVSAINSAMSYALKNPYVILLCGGGLAFVGALLILWCGEPARRRSAPPRRRPAPAPVSADNYRPRAVPAPKPEVDPQEQERLLRPRAPAPTEPYAAYAPPVDPTKRPEADRVSLARLEEELIRVRQAIEELRAARYPATPQSPADPPPPQEEPPAQQPPEPEPDQTPLDPAPQPPAQPEPPPAPPPEPSPDNPPAPRIRSTMGKHH